MDQTEEIEEIDGRGTLLQRRISTLVTILLVLAVLLCLYVAIQSMSNGFVNIGGFMMFRVVTGSMEPTIPVGALLVTKQADIQQIQLNDIVCFRTQEAEIWGKVVTHRVVELLNLENGEILLRTQGDANLVADGYMVTKGNLIGKVIWHTGDGSVVASIFSFFTNKVGFLGCIVFPCLLLAGLILRECVTNIQKDLRDTVYALEQEEEPIDPLCGMTQEEYMEMYERIRAELMEELKLCVEISEKGTTE